MKHFCIFFVAVYGIMYAAPNLTSFDVIAENTLPMETNYIGIVFLMIRSFFSAIAILTPRTLYGECFPLK